MPSLSEARPWPQSERRKGQTNVHNALAVRLYGHVYVAAVRDPALLRERMASDDFGIELGHVVDPGRLEARLGEAIAEVAAVDAHVVLCLEDAPALLGRQRRVLERRLAVEVHGRLRDQPAAGPDHPVDLAQR